MTIRTPIRIYLDDEAATERAGRLLARFLNPKDFVGLEGDLGAGKTCFARGILGGLTHAAVRVTSPTYTLMNHYQCPDPFTRVVHADLYRLADQADLESTGYWDALEDSDLAIVEWVDQIPSAQPDSGWCVLLTHCPPGRGIEITQFGTDSDFTQLAALSEALRAVSGGPTG